MVFTNSDNYGNTEGVEYVESSRMLPNFGSKLKNMRSLPKCVIYMELMYGTNIFIFWNNNHGRSDIFLLKDFWNQEKN